MKSWSKLICRAIPGILALAIAVVLCGCDSGSKTSEYKPLEGNILKKLGKASQEQSEASEANKKATRKRR